MTKNNENILKILLLIYVLLIFVLNASHINQQGTYNNIFIELAKNILAGNGYVCSELGNSTLFYPIWGYTILVLPDMFFSSGDLIIYVVQYILTIISILLFIKIFQIKLKFIHLFLFTPFIALMSVKWPDAIVGSLIIVYLYFGMTYLDKKKHIYLLLSGVIFGIIINFRSEYIFLPLFILVLLIIPKLKFERLKILYIALTSILIGGLLIVPWAMRAYSVTGELRLSASNGGAVMYISLGQLPNNSWGIIPLDETAYQIADSLNFDSPYSNEADNYFKSLSLQSIQTNPLEYAKKVGYNLFSSLTYGVYTGEYANSIIGLEHRQVVETGFASNNNIFKKIDYLLNADKFVTVPILIEKGLQGIFMIIFLYLILSSIMKLITGKVNLSKSFLILLLAIIIYKFAIVSAIQYEYRHMNAIYLLVLGIALQPNKSIFKM
jgi:hypothetical protein